jgi:hypothetical protein
MCNYNRYRLLVGPVPEGTDLAPKWRRAAQFSLHSLEKGKCTWNGPVGAPPIQQLVC